MVYVEIAARADKLTKSMLALLSRKFFAKLGDEILAIEALLLESAQGGHTGLLRMVFDAYSISGDFKPVETRFLRSAPNIMLPFVVNADIPFLGYLRTVFPSVSPVRLPAANLIGAKGNYEMLEYLEKIAEEGEKVSWQAAFEGACSGRQIDCAKRVFLRWKDRVEQADSMEVHLTFVTNSVTAASGSGSLDLFHFVRSQLIDEHWEKAIKESASILIRALQAGNTEVIDELLHEDAAVPTSLYEYAPNKAVVHFLYEKGFALPKDPWNYRAVASDDIGTVDALFHLGALFALRHEDIRSYEMLMWCLENLGHSSVPTKKIVYNLMCEAAAKDHINTLKKLYSALFYSEEKFGDYEIEVLSDKAARNGSLEVYKWLFEEKLLAESSGFHINIAITYGRFQMAKFIAERNPYLQRDIPKMCSNYGKMKILKWAVKAGYARKSWAENYIAARPVGDKSYDGYYNPNLVKVLNLLRTMLETDQLKD